jgi:Ca2+-binding EF-hand superfamily protein
LVYRQERTEMSESTSLAAVLAVALVFGVTAMGQSAAAVRLNPTAAALQKLDPDHDGTVDLTEANAAASALFDRLDRDRDGTLDSRELKGRLDPKGLAAGDPDQDGTLTKSEYLAVVEKQFHAADPDNDGTLDAKELGSPAGRALIRLTM